MFGGGDGIPDLEAANDNPALNRGDLAEKTAIVTGAVGTDPVGYGGM